MGDGKLISLERRSLRVFDQTARRYRVMEVKARELGYWQIAVIYGEGATRHLHNDT